MDSVTLSQKENENLPYLKTQVEVLSIFLMNQQVEIFKHLIMYFLTYISLECNHSSASVTCANRDSQALNALNKRLY